MSVSRHIYIYKHHDSIDNRGALLAKAPIDQEVIDYLLQTTIE